MKRTSEEPRGTGPDGSTGPPPGVLPDAFWALPAADALRRLGSGEGGLSAGEARRRALALGRGLRPSWRSATGSLLLAQFTSPMVLILLAAAVLSFVLGQRVDASIILGIVFGSGLLGYWQERGAAGAVEALLARVQVRSAVIRDGEPVEVPRRGGRARRPPRAAGGHDHPRRRPRPGFDRPPRSTRRR